MARKDSPIKVEIPKAGDDRPVWSRVGIIGAAGFVIGMAWPRFAGVHFGPNPPNDAHVAAESSADPSASPGTAPPPGSASAPAPGASAAEPPAANHELVVVGAGKITKCSDSKDKKIDDCGELQFDPIALPKVKDLSKCPSAIGLEGKLSIGFEIDFKAKEVHVVKGKKTTLPTSTVQGVLQCAAKDFATIALDGVPHKHRRYTLFYGATFYPPGKHPEEEKTDKPKEDGEDPAGTTTSESSATGQATVTWDRAPIRKEPKTGEVVTHAVKGTHVKILAKQNDWYRVEVGSSTGWVYRGALGL